MKKKPQIAKAVYLNFLSPGDGLSLFFLAAEELIKELTQHHQLEGSTLEYYQETLLSTIPIISFLKPGENIGFYIDSQEPYFRFKLETNFDGYFRTLLFPRSFHEIPKNIDALCRLVKIIKNQPAYTTTLKAKGETSSELINRFFHDSYQMDVKLNASIQSGRSVLLARLPENKNEERKDFQQILETYTNLAQEILSPKNSVEQAVGKILKQGFIFLSSKEVQFSCPCSKERFIRSLILMSEEDLNDSFAEENFLEIECDYCHFPYKILRSEIKKA